MTNRYEASQKLWEKSQKYLVPGSSTISKHPKLYTQGAYPIYLQKSEGCKITDVDGHDYIDFQSSLGAILLGHNHPAMQGAMKQQLGQGTLFSLSNPDLIQLAEKLCKYIPCAERVRILKNGSDATSAAVRIARAFTGRNKVVSCHFHGWHDWYYVICDGLNRGIPPSLKEDIIPFGYNDISQLEQIFSDNPEQVAAIIMEAVHLEEPQEGYLQAVKELAHKHGAVLIFDEVVTGFRFGIGGAQSHYEVTPDMACFAKALGNGMPIAAVVGREDIMMSTEDVITSQTYGEEALSVAAALAVLDIMEKEPVKEHVWKLGTLFRDGFNELAEKYQAPAKCIGLPPRLELVFDGYQQHSSDFIKAWFLQETAKNGMLFGNMIFMTYAHTEDSVQDALKVCDSVLQGIVQRPLTLEGKETENLW